MKRINWIDKLGRGSKYTYKEMLNAICPTQSTTAEYILQDLIASGIVTRKADKMYQVII